MTDDTTNIIPFKPQDQYTEAVRRWSEINLGPEPIEPVWEKWQQTLAQQRIWEAKYQAREFLREHNGSGFLLHVADDGIERRITIKDVGKGVKFLSVWRKDDWEYTRVRTYDWWRHPTKTGPITPRGAGWLLHDAAPEHWSWAEFKRPISKRSA